MLGMILDQLLAGLGAGGRCYGECRELFRHMENNLVCNWNAV